MSSSSAPVCKQKPSVCPPLPPSHLYMRVDDAVTYDVSVGHDVRFVAMTSDGSQVYFTSTEGLTPRRHRHQRRPIQLDRGRRRARVGLSGSGSGLHGRMRCLLDQPVRHRDDQNDPARHRPGDRPRQRRHLLLLARALISGKPGIDDEPNLYLFRNGQLSFVATFEPGRAITRSDISPDGNAFAFVTSSNLTGYDNAGFAEMYLYTPSTRSLKCVSCLPDGSPPTEQRRSEPARPVHDRRRPGLLRDQRPPRARRTPTGPSSTSTSTSTAGRS